MNTAHNIIPFRFENNDIRVAMRGDEPWFFAVDVCRALDLDNAPMAVSRLDEDEFTTISSNEGRHARSFGPQSFILVNESGLYNLVLGSRKEEAKRFKRWLTHDVLPSIRRTGRYEHPHAPPADDAAARQRAIDQKAMELAQATYPVMRGKFGAIADRLNLTTPGVHHVKAGALLDSGLLDMIPSSAPEPAAVPPAHQQMADVLHLRPGEPPAKDRTAAERARRYRARKRAKRDGRPHQDDPQ